MELWRRSDRSDANANATQLASQSPHDSSDANAVSIQVSKWKTLKIPERHKAANQLEHPAMEPTSGTQLQKGISEESEVNSDLSVVDSAPSGGGPGNQDLHQAGLTEKSRTHSRFQTIDGLEAAPIQ